MQKKILVVDDEIDVVKVLKKRLEDNQFNVVTAYDGDEGLDKMRVEKPNLVVLDVMMPMMDGYTFVRSARGDSEIRDIPIVVLTAKNGLMDLFEAEGVFDYVTKPYEIDMLLDKINKHLS